MTTLPPTLQYGMKVQLIAKSPQGADPKANYYITTYDKHGLVVLDDNNPITWTLVPTQGSTSQDVCYGDRLILVDDRGMVMNGQDTGTWGKGYISMKDRSVPGELNFHFSRPSQPLNKGTPVLLNDTTKGNKLHLHAFYSKGQAVNENAQKPVATKQPLTAERKSSSGCKGGYLRFNGTGSGQLIGFDIKVVDTSNLNANPVTALALTSPPAITSVSTVTPQSQSLRPPPTGEQDDDEAPVFAPSANAPAQSKQGKNNELLKRALNPDPYNVKEEVLPLRYGDKVKLIAKSPYNPEGGPVGLYRKHDLIAAGPIINAKTNKVEEGDDEDFVISQFIICGTGQVKTGDIVRYSNRLVLVDASNGNAVWNCRQTDTWTDGYLAIGPLVPNGVNPTPATEGPTLSSSNFSHITQNQTLPTGQVHVSFQPETPALLGYPVHNKDCDVFIDIEDTHQKKGKLNSRINVYKKKSSMMVGGYLYSHSSTSGKPVTFTIERVQHVPLNRKTPYVEKTFQKTSGYVQETTLHYRRDATAVRNYRTRERKKSVVTALTLLSAIISFGYFAQRYKHDAIGQLSDVLTDTAGKVAENTQVKELISFLGYPLIVEQYLYYKQILYMFLTLILALCSIALNTSTDISPYHDAQQQQGGLVQVEVEHNLLDIIILDAQSEGKGNDPNQWMYDAGLDPDNIIVPERYVSAEKGDAVKGKKRFIVTHKWRYINQLETILDRPHPLFRIIKQHTVQLFYGKCLKGNVVYYETPKRANLPALDGLGVTIEELLFHFVYITEYLYQHLDTRLDARCVSVVDLSGIAFADFGGKVVDFVQQVAKITQTHYPERSAGILCINAGWAFQLIWKIVSTMMDPVTRSKTHLWGSDFVEKMTAVIAADQIPAVFGGQGRFTPSIPAKGPVLPQDSISQAFNAIEIEPLSIEEENMFKLADAANLKWSSENAGQQLPRPLLKDKLPPVSKY